MTPESTIEMHGRSRGWMRHWTWRGAALVLCALASISCCPVPAGLAAEAKVASAAPADRTAFVARIAADLDGSWLAETDTGARHRIAGEPPGAVGTPVYVEGWIESNGTVVIERAGRVDTR